MVMIEGLASGLPVVAARTGAAHEIVSEGRNGLLYEPDSKAELTAAVQRIVGDNALRGTMSRGARAAAEERGWEASTTTLRSYYEEALSAEVERL